jgi:GNAT superfamily N-acetyltransferase
VRVACGASVMVRPLVPADRAQWQPLWQGYLEFYRTTVAPEVHDVTFARLTGGREPMGGFIAIEGGEAVGIVHWITHRSCWTVGDYCYLQDLFVAPGRRSSGIGRSLIEAVYEKARTLGCPRVYWLTHETNAVAMWLYDSVADRSGFVQYRKTFSAAPP